MGVLDGVAGRSEHRLSVPEDSRNWSSSQESLSSFCEMQGSPESECSPARGMEAEELALPEMMTVYSPDLPSVEVSQFSSEVQKLCSKDFYFLAGCIEIRLFKLFL